MIARGVDTLVGRLEIRHRALCGELLRGLEIKGTFVSKQESRA
jgi:hypothetical protein